MKKIILASIVYLIIANLVCASSTKVLIIGSYHKDYQFQIDYIKGLRDTLGKNYEYFEFDLNTKKIKESEYKNMADKAFDYYKKIKPDLVVLGDDNALKLLKDRFIKEKIPVVFLGINANIRNYFKDRPENFTGVLERPLYQRNIAFMKDCLPGLQSVLILFDDSETSRTIVEEAFQGKFNSSILSVSVDIRLVDTVEAWQNIVNEESGKYSAIIIGLYSTLKDKKDKVIDENYMIDWTSKNIRKPLFGTWSFSVGNGKTIGGLVLSGTDQGVEAGKIIKRILENGEKPISIFPVIAQKGEYLVSKSELNRWKILIPTKYKNIVKEID